MTSLKNVLWLLLRIAYLLILSTFCTASTSASTSTSDSSIRESLTVIDILSQNVEFSAFLRILQRSGLVPLLNQLTNTTLIAPVNSAFLGDIEDESTIMSADRLKQYIIGESFLSADIKGTTLKHSLQKSNNNVYTPVLIDNLINGLDGDSGLKVDNIEVVEPDLIAYSQDSVVHGINQQLPQKPPLCEFLSRPGINNTFAYFSSLLFKDYCPLTQSEVTLILPTDQSVTLNEVELNYLVSKYGTADREYLTNLNILRGYHGGSNENDGIAVYQNLNNENVEFKSTNNGHSVDINGKPAILPNILTHDAVVHVVGYFNASSVQFTLRKYLYGLGNSDFVEQLVFRHLEKLIDNPYLNQTLLVYNDEDDDEENTFSQVGQLASIAASAHRGLLLYHFIDGKIDAQGSGLYDTKFCSSKKIGGRCQKIKLCYNQQRNTIVVNDDAQLLPALEPPLTVGNTDIYFLNKEYSLPLTFKKSVSSLDRCTKSMKYLNQFGLLDLKNNKKGYTIFLPCFDSWAPLDLTLDYLESNHTAFDLILKNGIINDIIYSDTSNDLLTSNLNDDLVDIKVLNFNSNSFTTLSINDKEIQIEKNSDIIFDQGVVQPINSVIIPKNVQVTLSNLLDTAQAQRFIELLEFTNLSYVLHDPNYSIIVPTLSSFLKDNFTEHTPLPILTSFLKLHILPNNHTESGNHDSLFTCGSRIPTLLESVHLSCRQINKKLVLLQLVEGLDYEVRILKSGCTTLSNQSCVFILDKAISPEWLNTGKKLKFHFPIAAVGIGFICGIIFIFTIVPCCLLFTVGKGRKSATSNSDESENLNSNGDGADDQNVDDEEAATERSNASEHDPLLYSSHNNGNYKSYNNGNSGPGSGSGSGIGTNYSSINIGTGNTSINSGLGSAPHSITGTTSANPINVRYNGNLNSNSGY